MTHTHSKIQLHYFWPGMSPVNRHQHMGHVPVSGRFERVAMDLLDVSVISANGHTYILVVCDEMNSLSEKLTDDDDGRIGIRKTPLSFAELKTEAS